MLVKLGDRLTALFRATAPDPFVLAVLLTGATFALALAFGSFEAGSSRVVQTIGHWQNGFWSLLAFSMQMCLILVTGHALASAGPVARGLRAIAGTARTARGGVALTALVAIGAGLVNWGLGLIVGSLLARDVDRALRERGCAPPAGLLAAAAYTTMMVWHGGLSGSAPLAAASEKDLAATVGADLAARLGGSIGLERTTFSGLNVLTTLGLVVLVPATLVLLCPRSGAGGKSAPATEAPRGAGSVNEDEGLGRVPRWLERSPLVVWVVAAPALVWLAMEFASKGLGALTLNSANLAFLALGMALHGSARRYMEAVSEAAAGCAGILVQFPLYAGVIGVVGGTGLIARIADASVAASGGGAGALSGLTFLSAALVNLFVPSGGGQWAVQGPIAMRAALDAGVDPGRLVMAVAYGDQLTNMIQPFWALPLLSITGQRAGAIVGYAAVAMVVGGGWILGCLWVAG